MCCVLALGTGEVDEVWWVPVHTHAFGKELAPFADRIRMCELATDIFSEKVRVVGIEAELSNHSGRTLDTLEALAGRHPDYQFRLLIGSDILQTTDAWHRWDRVVELAPPLVIPRLEDFSSTRIRDEFASGQFAETLVPRAVIDYIAERGLYA